MTGDIVTILILASLYICLVIAIALWVDIITTHFR